MNKTKNGLKSSDIVGLRAQYGYNKIEKKTESLLLIWLKEFWTPLAWLLELTTFLAYISHDIIESIIIIGLLFINSFISITQRSKASKALEQLSKTLQINVRVYRDNTWQVIEASELLPGDVVRLRVGDIVSADMIILEGNLSVDQSSITGESLAVEVQKDDNLFSGSTLVRGEATALVQAIGMQTKYGTTAELLDTSHPPTHMEKVVFSIIKYQFIFNIILIIVALLYVFLSHHNISIIIPLAIVLLLSSVPVAFPAMFTIAQAFGALQMAHIQNKKGVLVRRLAAVQDGATMNVLCTDKTGTLTQNKLSVVEVIAYSDYKKDDVTAVAAACSNVSDSDPIDLAILNFAKDQSIVIPHQLSFTPFDPLTKETAALAEWNNDQIKIIKGLPLIILNQTDNQDLKDQCHQDVAKLSQKGYRVLAVAIATKDNNQSKLAGLIALADPIRSDSKQLLHQLRDMGIDIKMITGDNLETAQSVAEQLNLPGLVCRARELKEHPEWINSYSVFAEAYPEDKILIISTLQRAGFTVGMTGDGVNDAPALRQAEVGIAVMNATDIAKGSASLILTNPGLTDIVSAVMMSRQVYSRIRTWTMNKIIKGFQVAVFTIVTYLLTGSLFLTPLIIVLIMFANDFVTISIASDNSVADNKPANWSIGRLMFAAIFLAVGLLSLLIVGLLLSIYDLGFDFHQLQTMAFLLLVFQGQASLYALRSFPHFWNVKPSRLLAIATSAMWIIFIPLALFGIIIPKIPINGLWIIFMIPIVSLLVTDRLKILVKNYY